MLSNTLPAEIREQIDRAAKLAFRKGFELGKASTPPPPTAQFADMAQVIDVAMGKAIELVKAIQPTARFSDCGTRNYGGMGVKPTQSYADESDADEDRIHALLIAADSLKGKVDDEVLAKILGDIADNPEWFDAIVDGQPMPASATFADWVYEEGPRGGKRWKNSETGRYVYTKEKPGGTREAKQQTREEAHTRANEIIRNHIHAKATPDELRELLDHIPHLSHEQLSSVRARLMASFGGKRKLAERIEALKSHITELAKPEEEKAPPESSDKLKADEPESEPTKPEEKPNEPAESREPGRSESGRSDADSGRTDRGSVDGQVGEEPAKPLSPRVLTDRAELTPKPDLGLVPESLRQHLTSDQQTGVALGVAAVDRVGGFLLADSTGVGKTRQLLGMAKTFADKGKKVVIVAPAEVIKPDWKKGAAGGSYTKDGEAMGIAPDLIKGESPLQSGKIHITTYGELNGLKGQVDGNTIVLFDESHALKNSGSARGKNGRDIGFKAGGVVYATATPADKPLHIGHLIRAGVFGGGDESAKKFFGKSADTYTKLGLVERTVRTPHGEITKWEVNRKVGAEEVMNRIGGLFDQMTKEGLMVRRYLSMDGIKAGFDQVQLPPEAQAEVQKVYDEAYKNSDSKGLALVAMRQAQEVHKVPHVASMVQEELAAGRRPIVFLGRVNDLEGDEDKEDNPAVDTNTANALRKALVDAGIPESDIGELHGAVTKTADAKRSAMNKFQSGKTKVLISTIQSGGTGVNLDDTVGDAPRTVIMMTPPLSANDAIQAAGRVHRMSTKSESRIRTVVSDHPIDTWNTDLLARKLGTLGATVGGLAKGLGESPEDEEKKPFAWGESLVRPKKTESATTSSGAASTPSSKPEFKVVNTKNGVRHIHSFSPSKAFWDARKAGKLPSNVGVGKNQRGDWEATIWGQSPDDTRKTISKLQDMGLLSKPKDSSSPAPTTAPAETATAPMHPDRKAAIHAAVKTLAGMDDDRARELNGMGYNQLDSQFGADLAKQHTLSDRQAEAAAQMLQKYRRQLGGDVNHLLHDKHWGNADASRSFADESDDTGPNDPDADRINALLIVADELKGKVDPHTLAEILGKLADDPEGYDAVSTGQPHLLSSSMDFADWTYEEGPRGGKRWKNNETGRYVYGAEKPGGKREAATKTREEAHKAANTIIRDHIHGKATPDQLRDLINHIPHLNHAQLSSVRARLMASFGGKRGLQDRIEALKKHIEDMNEPDALDFGQEAMDHGKTGKVKRKEDPAKKVEPPVAEAEARNRWDKGQQIEDKAKGKEDPRSLARPEQLEQAKQEDWKAQEDKRKGDTLEQPPVKPAKKKPKIHETDATLSHIIKNRGGIRSDDHSFKAHFGSIKEAMEYGLSLGLFNKNSKQGLDQIAKSMAAEGHLIVPEGEDPVPHLVEGLKRKARSAAEDLTSKYDKAYEEYGKALEEAKNDGITSEQIAAAEAEADRIGEAKGAEDKYGQSGSGIGDDTDFGFGANESKQPESGSGSGSVDLFGNPIPKSYSAKAGQQITMDDALREAWVNKAHEWADEHGTKVSSLTASGAFKAGGKEYQVGKAEDGYPIKEIGAAAPVATSKVEPSTPKATQPTPKAPVEGPPPSLDEVSRLYDMISQPNVSQGHVQQMMDRLKNAKKGDLKAIGDKIGMEFGASDTAGKMQEKIAKRFLNLKHGAMKSDSLNAANERAKKEEHEAKRRAKLGIPEPERDTPKFKKRRFDLEDELNGLTSDASDDLYQSLDDAETHTDLDTIAAKIKAEKAKSGSRPKPVAPVLPAPAPAPEQPRRDYVHNPNAKGDPTPDEVAGLHDNIARRDITEPQVQQVADRIQGIKSKATLKEIGQKIDMTFGASDTVKQMADKVIKRLLNMKRTHIKSTIFDRKQEKPTEAAPAKAPTPAPSKFLAPHEMSREDYIKQQQPKIEAEVKKIPQDYLQDRQRLALQRQAGFEHQDAVKAAVEKGQPVHESAAKDYPNIKPVKKIEPQEHEKPLYEFAKTVQQLADTSPYEERFGDKKAFISDIYKRSQTSGALPKMTLDQFKQQLLDANNKSFLNLATQDDPNIVPRDKHDESQIEYLGNPFHHVLTSDAGKYNDKEHHKSRETQEKAWGLGLGEKGYYNNNQ